MAPSKPRVFRSSAAHRLNGLDGTPLASFKARAAALTIDLLVVLAIVILIGLPAAFRHRAHDPSGQLVVHFDPFHSFWGLLVMILYVGFGTFLGRGQTFGKRLLHIRVVSTVHSHLSLWHSIERALGYGASTLEGGFGFLQYFIHPNRQTVHDRIAETIVISDPKKSGGAT